MTRAREIVRETRAHRARLTLTAKDWQHIYEALDYMGRRKLMTMIGVNGRIAAAQGVARAPARRASETLF